MEQDKCKYHAEEIKNLRKKAHENANGITKLTLLYAEISSKLDAIHTAVKYTNGKVAAHEKFIRENETFVENEKKTKELIKYNLINKSTDIMFKVATTLITLGLGYFVFKNNIVI